MFATDEDRSPEEDWKNGLTGFDVRAHAQQQLLIIVDKEAAQQQQQLPALA